MTTSTDLPKLVQRIQSKQLLVFDFDGVLADSVEVKTVAFAKLYEAHGEDVVTRVVNHHRDHGGMSRFDKIKHYHSEFLCQNLDADELVAWAGRFSDIVKQAVIAAPEIGGAREVLSNFHDQGKICTINSATPENEMIDIVRQRGLANYFFRVFGSPSSKVENLKKILDQSGVPAAAALYFGDALSDHDAALSMRVDFVGIGDRMGDNLDAMDAEYFSITDFRELNQLLGTGN